MLTNSAFQACGNNESMDGRDSDVHWTRPRADHVRVDKAGLQTSLEYLHNAIRTTRMCVTKVCSVPHP